MLNLKTFLVTGVLAFVIGAGLGYRYRGGQEAKEKVEVLTEAVQDIAEQKNADDGLSKRQAVERTEARVQTREITMKGVADANLKARPDGGWDAHSFSLLHDAIDTANGRYAGHASGLSEPVRTDAKTARPL